MPVTLAQAKLLAPSDIDVNVIDEFRKSSAILDALTFDDAVSAAGNGATLTYGYTRLITQPTAAFRAINSEYTPQEVTKAQYTVDLKPLEEALLDDLQKSDKFCEPRSQVVKELQQLLPLLPAAAQPAMKKRFDGPPKD